MLMDKLLDTAATQAPGIVILFLMVNLFLRRDKERDSFIQSLHQEHLLARAESREAIRENTASNRDLSAAMGVLNEAVRDQMKEQRLTHRHT